MSEPWTGAEHEPRNPDEWWVGCVCGNNHTVSWFRSQWAGRAVQDDGLPTRDELAEAILRHDADDSWPSGSQVAHDRGRCGNNRCATAILNEIARLRAAPPLHDPTPASESGLTCPHGEPWTERCDMPCHAPSESRQQPPEASDE